MDPLALGPPSRPPAPLPVPPTPELAPLGELDRRVAGILLSLEASEAPNEPDRRQELTPDRRVHFPETPVPILTPRERRHLERGAPPTRSWGRSRAWIF